MRVNRKPNVKQMVKEASATKKALIKKLPESVKKNLKEDIYDDMITPGIEVLDMLDRVKAENPNLSTPEFEDLISDIEKALNQAHGQIMRRLRNLVFKTPGINLNERFEACGIGIISINNKPFTKSGVIGAFGFYQLGSPWFWCSVLFPPESFPWIVGILYFLIRIAGKYLGAWSGCKMVKKSAKVSRYLGLALIPQAGVAIGLAAMGAREIGGEMGEALETIILSSSVLYELIGPACAKMSLYLSGSYSNKLEEKVEVEETTAEGVPKTEAQLLIERIARIQSELPPHDPEGENERAFTEAAEEYYREQYRQRKTRAWNRIL